ncbi:MAG: trigger factor [Steroidobacteraceae bacterium]|jgi:trigger factor|nr:trigger factor [Steroidobacteraceae bacterium]
MMVLVQNTGSLERRVEVSVPAAEVEQAYEARLKSFSRTARLKGFRPGKAPLNVVRRQFGPQIQEEVTSDVVRQSLARALEQQRLNPVGGTRIEPLSMTMGQDLRYAAVFEVYPEVEIKGLESIFVVKPVAEVTAADVEAMIENLRGQRPNYVEATRPAQDGDRVTVDFEGKLDGIAFEGGTAQAVPVLLGGGRMLKDFEAGLQGVSRGDTRTFPVKFPDDYGKAELAGRTAEFTVTVKDVQQKELPPVDEEFCRAFGVADGGVVQLQKEVEENMKRELENTIRSRLKTQLMDKLLEANPVEVPTAALESQVRELQVDWLRRMGADPKQLKEAPPREPFEATARRRVALGILIGEIIRREGVRVDAARLEERIESAAAGYPDPEDAARQIRDNRELLSQLEAVVLEDQVVDWLTAKVKVTEQPTSFKDLMNFGG